MIKKKSLFTYSMFFIVCFSLDRLSKWLAFNNLQNKLIAISDNLNLSIVWNKGISWGLFGNSTSFHFWLLTSFIILVITIFTLYTFIQYKNNSDITFETIVIAGALSNVFDRFLYGSVLDFVDFYINTWHWPTFNVADICVVIGILGLVIRNILCSQD